MTAFLTHGTQGKLLYFCGVREIYKYNTKQERIYTYTYREFFYGNFLLIDVIKTSSVKILFSNKYQCSLYHSKSAVTEVLDAAVHGMYRTAVLQCTSNF